jgi:hypothetical protein
MPSAIIAGERDVNLASAGFSDVTIDGLHGPMWFGNGRGVCGGRG